MTSVPDGDNISTTGFPSPPQMVGASFGMEHREISSLSSTISELSQELRGLKDSLGKFNSFSANSFNSVIGQVENQANQALAAVNQLTGAVASVGGGGATTGAGGGRAGGMTGFGEYFSRYESPLVSAGMTGISWLRDRVSTNRNVALGSAGAFGMTARQQGVDVSDIMSQVSRFPGSIYGTPQELMDIFAAAPRLGASFGFGGQQGQGVRAQGMLAGIRQAQMLNPGESVQSIMGNVGGFAANTQAQQRSQMITGGAMGMIGVGGRQKSLTQWAEDTLRWLENLRGGGQRGKPFNYGELMAQYFPGSNIDAWFDVNGVPPNMKEYWWTYALGKANKTGGTGGGEMEITPDRRNLAQARLRSTAEMTRTEFGVGAKMTPSYVNRESMNQWFNSMMGGVQEMLFSLLGSKLNFLQYLPDTIEDLLFSGVEMGARSVDSALGSFGGIGNLIQMVALSGGAAVADVEGWPAGAGSGIGDIGGYGHEGGTGLAGLSPNMRSKLGPMMRANPRLKVTSGLRDNAMQMRLKRQGYSRVSGKPSAHTRGDAADLGPQSEYPWIVANAKKFGLRSGIKQGEPWHVGVGDPLDWVRGGISDVAGGILGAVPGGDALMMIGKLLSGLSGMFGQFEAGGLGMLGGLMKGGMGGLLSGNPLALLTGLGLGADPVVGAAKTSENLLGVLLGPLAGMAKGASGQFSGYDDTLLQRLSSQQISLGGLPSNVLSGGGLLGLGGGLLNPLSGIGMGLDAIGAIGGALGGSGGGFSGVPSERAMTVARLASQYWHGEDLIKAVAISGRESSWDPKAHRTDTRPKNPAKGDRGLFQINYVNDPSMMSKGLYDNPSDLFDPAVNTRVAYELWKGGGWKPWSMTSGGWQQGGDPMYGAKVEEARAAIHAAGVGDVERMQYQSFAPQVSQHGGFHLDLSNSTFQIPQQMLGGMNGQQIDVRRTVTLLADYLEEEMNRRMARAN